MEEQVSSTLHKNKAETAQANCGVGQRGGGRQEWQSGCWWRQTLVFASPRAQNSTTRQAVEVKLPSKFMGGLHDLASRCRTCTRGWCAAGRIRSRTRRVSPQRRGLPGWSTRAASRGPPASRCVQTPPCTDKRARPPSRPSTTSPPRSVSALTLRGSEDQHVNNSPGQ